MCLGGPLLAAKYGLGGPLLAAKIGLGWDHFWQGGTTFGCQKWSGGTSFGGEHFWHDSPLPGLPVAAQTPSVYWPEMSHSQAAAVSR